MRTVMGVFSMKLVNNLKKYRIQAREDGYVQL